MFAPFGIREPQDLQLTSFSNSIIGPEALLKRRMRNQISARTPNNRRIIARVFSVGRIILKSENGRS